MKPLTALTEAKMRQQTVSTHSVSAASVLPILLLFSLVPFLRQQHAPLLLPWCCLQQAVIVLFFTLYLYSLTWPRCRCLFNKLYLHSVSPLGTEVNVNTRPQSSALCSVHWKPLRRLRTSAFMQLYHPQAEGWALWTQFHEFKSGLWPTSSSLSLSIICIGYSFVLNWCSSV